MDTLLAPVIPPAMAKSALAMVLTTLSHRVLKVLLIKPAQALQQVVCINPGLHQDVVRAD
jgi:hypothetical protein